MLFYKASHHRRQSLLLLLQLFKLQKKFYRHIYILGSGVSTVLGENWEVINICLCYIITFHYVAAPIRLTLRRRLRAHTWARGLVGTGNNPEAPNSERIWGLALSLSYSLCSAECMQQQESLVRTCSPA